MIKLHLTTRRVRTFAYLTLAGLLILSSFAAQFVNRAKAQQSTALAPDIVTIAPGLAYRQTNLSSDLPGIASILDPLLVNPWGVAIGSVPVSGLQFWITNSKTSTSTLYRGDVSGSPLVTPFSVTIPGDAPTATVANTTTDFVVSGPLSSPATIIFASRTGNITGVPSASVGNKPQPVTALSRPGDVYTGLAIGNSGSSNYLYVANFAGPTLAGSIETFNSAFALQSVATFPFNDTAAPAIPADFRPFNITNLGGALYVSYARAGAGGVVLNGPGLGFVSKFDTGGNFVSRLISNGPLDAPWGMAIAPAAFGTFSGAFLAGNFSPNGRINAFNATTGALLGTLQNEAGNPIEIDGLRALLFGNGTTAGDSNTLYFTAGLANQAHGLFGSLKPTTATATSLVQFSADNFTVGEAGGHVDIIVTREGDTSGTATVNVATYDVRPSVGPLPGPAPPGRASQISDYEIALAKITFNPGETSKTQRILIVNDLFVEGSETVNLVLSNPAGTGVGLGSPNQATVTITDNDVAPATTNPIDDPTFFVSQQYLDFLNREPDASGLSFWTSQITSCGADTACIEVRRINTSGAFFLSIEFQNTGMLAYLASRASLTEFGGAVTKVPLLYGQFERDTQALQKGYIFGAAGAEAVLETNKQAYFSDFVTRPEFVARYPASLTPAQYVDTLMSNAGFSTDKSFPATLGGGQVVPPNASPATARAGVTLNAAETQISVIWFLPFGLSSFTAVHVHGPAAPGANGPILFTIPNDSATRFDFVGPIFTTLLLFDVTPAQVADLKAGRWYFDIHSTSFPAGEIRGQFPASAQVFRDSLVTGLSASTETRATVLRRIAESSEFRSREFNNAFVLMQYFGYLRRDPDSGGYDFWLGKLNLFGGDFRTSEMVKAFIISAEYRQRFGP